MQGVFSSFLVGRKPKSATPSGQLIPVNLPELNRLTDKVAAAKTWQDKTSKVFVRKGYTKLLEVHSCEN